MDELPWMPDTFGIKEGDVYGFSRGGQIYARRDGVVFLVRDPPIYTDARTGSILWPGRDIPQVLTP